MRPTKDSVKESNDSEKEAQTREMMLPLSVRFDQAEISMLLVEMGKVVKHYYRSLVGEVSTKCVSNNVTKDVSEVFEALCSGQAMVPPRGSCSLYGQPQVVMRPERLVLDDRSCRTFAISDIKVGKCSQLAASGLVPGSSAAASAFGVRLKCDTAQISMNVSVDLVNMTDDWQPYPTATFIGLTTCP